MKQHILAIDDELDMLKLLERIITEKTPYRITTTNNSLEVEQLLEQTQFDLIITDLKMPGLDGMDVLRLVKEKKRYEEVIILTAFGSMEVRNPGSFFRCFRLHHQTIQERANHLHTGKSHAVAEAQERSGSNRGHIRKRTLRRGM